MIKQIRIPSKIFSQRPRKSVVNSVVNVPKVSDNVQPKVQIARRRSRKELLGQSSMLINLNHIYLLSRKHIPDFKLVSDTSFVSRLDLINYFNRVYPLQELPGILEYVKKHPDFDFGNYLSIKASLAKTKELFFANIKKASEEIQIEHHVKLHPYEVDDITFLFWDRVLRRKTITHFIPTPIEDILGSVKLNTSSGAPDADFKKRDKFEEISINLRLMYNGDFDWKRFKFYPDIAGLRSQVRVSGLKTRLIFIVNSIRQSLENVFRTTFVNTFLINNESEISYARTQAELSEISQHISGKYVICIDYKSFDHSIPRDLMVFAFLLIENSLMLSGHWQTSFRYLRNICIKAEMFHPCVGLVSRLSGLSSGSSFTSLIGSVVNFVVTYSSLLTYCHENKIDFWNEHVFCRFSGDDGVISTSFRVDSKIYLEIVKRRFGMLATVEYDSGASSSGDTFFFLGSKWIQGVPYRCPKRLLLQILFGNGNMPKMSDKARFISRAFDIFGNDCKTEDNFLKCGIDFERLPSKLRLFRFKDTFFSNSAFLETRSSLSFESRGEWHNLTINRSSDLNSVWLTR